MTYEKDQKWPRKYETLEETDSKQGEFDILQTIEDRKLASIELCYETTDILLNVNIISGGWRHLSLNVIWFLKQAVLSLQFYSIVL